MKWLRTQGEKQNRKIVETTEMSAKTFWNCRNVHVKNANISLKHVQNDAIAIHWQPDDYLPNSTRLAARISGKTYSKITWKPLNANIWLGVNMHLNKCAVKQ